jgi:hypothetical protein
VTRRALTNTRNTEPAKALWVADGIDFDDPSAGNGGSPDRERLSTLHHDDPSGAVHQCTPQRRCGVLTCAKARAARGGRCTTNHCCRPSTCWSGVRTQHDVRVEDGDQCIKVPDPRRGEEGVHDLALNRQFDIRNWRKAAHSAPCPTG